MNIFGKEYTREEIESRVGSLDQICGIRPLQCTEGQENGTRLFRVWNSNGLQLDVLADRGMDIGMLSYRGIPLTWTSKTGYVHPSNLQEQGWPGGFHGGLIATCGLNNVGPDCEEDGKLQRLHGRISGLPATGVSYNREWKENRPRMTLSGVVKDCNSRGYHMELSRFIEVEGDSGKLSIVDTVTNRGLQQEPCMIMYHINFGFPFIDQQTELFTSLQGEPQRISDLQTESAVSLLKVDEIGLWGEVGLRQCDVAQGLDVRIRYRLDTLPHTWRWYDFRRGMGVLAIEPSNCPVRPRTAARKAGCLPMLNPGEQVKYELAFEMRTLST